MDPLPALAKVERDEGVAVQRSPVQLEKHFYAVRPALALRWLRVNEAGFPPMDVSTLRAGAPLSDDEGDALDDMIRTEVLMAEAAALAEPKPPPDASLVAEASRILVRAAEFADQRVGTVPAS